MPDNWNPGDVAECIDDLWSLNGQPFTGAAPKVGVSYLVLEVIVGTCNGVKAEGLRLSGFGRTDYWQSGMFRKRPPGKEEPKREEEAPLWLRHDWKLPEDA